LCWKGWTDDIDSAGEEQDQGNPVGQAA
jgi:hypothetical protein